MNTVPFAAPGTRSGCGIDRREYTEPADAPVAVVAPVVVVASTLVVAPEVLAVSDEDCVLPPDSGGAADARAGAAARLTVTKAAHVATRSDLSDA